MKRLAFFSALLITLAVTLGCSQPHETLKGEEKKLQPQPVQNLNNSVTDIESQLNDLQDLERSIEIINNMSFQI